MKIKSPVSPKLVLVASFCLLFSALTSQNCSTIKKGDRSVAEVITYPSLADKIGPDFYSMKPKKKAEKATAYSAELNSGKVASASSFTFPCSITSVDAEGEHEVSYDIAGTTYKSYLICKDNQMYIIRVKGVMLPYVTGKDTLGFFTKGTQVIPNDLKVGMLTPGYIDESIMAYNSTDVRKTDFAVAIGNTRYSGYVPAKVNYSVKGKVITIHQSGVVYGEETVKISGREFKCYNIRTEIWTKNDTKADTKIELENWFSDPAFNKQIRSQMENNANAAGATVKAKMEDMLGANAAGYIVTYKEESFAPGYGIVRTRNYDQWGCLTSITQTKEIL